MRLKLLRDDAMARKTGRTSKTPNGAKPRSIISSVLQSIGKSIGTFTLSAVIAEVQRWLEIGESSFAAEVQELKARVQDLRPPNPAPETTAKSLLDRIVLSADSCSHPSLTYCGQPRDRPIFGLRVSYDMSILVIDNP